MNRNTQDKMLIVQNQQSIFYKIKMFFIKIFSFKEKNIEENNANYQENIMKIQNDKKKEFLEYVKNIENEETKLFKLQKQYHNGEIREEDLTEEQKKALCDLYDKQNETLRKTNETRRKRIAELKNRK